MEEKKQRNKFYSAWAKGIVIALFLTAVACFSVFAMIFGGDLRSAIAAAVAGLAASGYLLLCGRHGLPGDSGLWTADGFTGK